MPYLFSFHAEEFSQGQTLVSGVCSYEYVPHSHLGNIFMRTEPQQDFS